MDSAAITALNTLTRNATAFVTWDELETALKGGYVPTLRPTDEAQMLLGVEIIRAGYRVWSPLNGQTYGGGAALG
jgi:hypothetical protein